MYDKTDHSFWHYEEPFTEAHNLMSLELGQLNDNSVASSDARCNIAQMLTLTERLKLPPTPTLAPTLAPTLPVAPNADPPPRGAPETILPLPTALTSAVMTITHGSNPLTNTGTIMPVTRVSSQRTARDD